MNLDITAARWFPNQGLKLVREPRPRPDLGEVLVEPVAVGLCGTDLHILSGSFPAAPRTVLGHEICARIITPTGRLQRGDLVSVEPHRYCTQCYYCRSGQEHLCDDKAGYGVRLDGGFATLMRVPERILYRLPDDIAPTIGAMTEPVACCIHGMDALAPKSGESLLVHGAGPAGAILVALTRLQGCNPIVVLEPNPRRRQLALSFGADHVLDPRDPRTQEKALSLVEGRGYRNVIDAVGSASVLEASIDLAARGGRVLVFGVASPEEHARVAPHALYLKELTLLGSAINPYTHQRAVNLLGRLPLTELRAKTFALSEIEAAVTAQRSGAFDKVFVIPNQMEDDSDG